MSEEKSKNKLKRKQSPQIRLYRAIQDSLEKRKQLMKNIKGKKQVFSDEKKIFSFKRLNLDINNRESSNETKKRFFR